jgi:thymidylate kinase
VSRTGRARDLAELRRQTLGRGPRAELADADRIQAVVPSVPTIPDEQRPLDLVLRLCRELEAAGVAYCHFKSNEALHRSLTGENDLDLLVGAEGAERFLGVLSALGFKEGRPPRVRRIPGVAQYYGLDAETGRLVQVHAHRRLVFGDDTTKNFALDLEDAYIASAQRGPHLPVPSVEYEFLLFTLRMVVKHCTLDAMLMLQGRWAASERRELIWLTDRADLTEVRELVRTNLPFVGQDLFDRCIAAIKPGCSRWFRVRTAGRLHRALGAHRRRGRFADASLRIIRRVSWVSRRLLRGRPGKRLARGGALIAVVGGDGAGKSTAIAGLAAWLSGPFDVARVHLGKPPPSLLSIVVKGPMYVLRTVGAFRSTSVPVQSLRERGGSFPGYGWLVWHVLTARDRYRAYARSRRSVLSGRIVLADRFPLQRIRTMDGEKTTWLMEQRDLGFVARWLVSVERGYYARFTWPDRLIVLRVDPAIAVQRKQCEEEAEFVRPRSNEVWQTDWSDTPAVVVDAGQEREEVQATLRTIVWSRL